MGDSGAVRNDKLTVTPCYDTGTEWRKIVDSGMTVVTLNLIQGLSHFQSLFWQEIPEQVRNDSCHPKLDLESLTFKAYFDRRFRSKSGMINQLSPWTWFRVSLTFKAVLMGDSGVSPEWQISLSLRGYDTGSEW